MSYVVQQYEPTTQTWEQVGSSHQHRTLAEYKQSQLPEDAVSRIVRAARPRRPAEVHLPADLTERVRQATAGVSAYLRSLAADRAADLVRALAEIPEDRAPVVAAAIRLGQLADPRSWAEQVILREYSHGIAYAQAWVKDHAPSPMT